ncbi:hypothetical protein GOEFS_094_00450 [Gordonia effusa NBRC 100432]|uniref:Uncharacterized protein n=1 Tax=Gordonia effusa NBRC 100432 TaxID=1077974 RepID=H0R3U5_9ACTN|nr:hypothetical protein GOEFS_094_00450 [Gordonia effusa NBRC 100432]
MLQLAQGNFRLAGDLAHGRSLPTVLVNDAPQGMSDRFTSLVVINLLRHPIAFPIHVT